MFTFTRILLACLLTTLLISGCQSPIEQTQDLHLGWLWPSEVYRLQGAMAIGQDGSFYVTDAEGTLHAIDRNGKQLWSYHGDYGIASAAVLSKDGNALYFVTDIGILYALSLQGQPLWGIQSNQPFVAMPSVAPNGDIYVQTDGGGFRISPSGEAQPFPWPLTLVDQISFDSQSRIYLYATLSELQGEALILNEQGELLAECPLNNRRYGPLPVSNNAWAYTDLQGSLHILDFQCQPLWNKLGNQTASEITTSPFFTTEQAIYFPTSNAQILALTSTGQVIWQITLSPGRGPVTHIQPIGNNLLTITSDNHMMLLDSQGTLLWSQWLYEAGAPGKPQATPQGGFGIVQNGRLLVYTPNPNQQLAYPKPTPTPAERASAAIEIKNAAFDYIFTQWIYPLEDQGNTDPSLIVFAPAADLNTHSAYLNHQTPYQLWKYVDGKIVEAKDPASALEAFFATRNDPQSLPWKYYEFGIFSIEENLHYANVYIARECGTNCSQGIQYTFHRSPSGVWWVTDLQTLWQE